MERNRNEIWDYEKSFSIAIKMIKQNKLQIIIPILLLITIHFLMFFQYLKVNEGYAPTYSDEYGYFLQTKAFVLNHCLYAPLVIDENYSLIGMFGGHGFMYGLFHGIIGVIFSFNELSIIHTNYILYLLSASIPFLFNTCLFKRIACSLLLSSYFIAYLLTFSYMQENIFLFFSPIYSYLIFKLFFDYSKQYLIFFVFIVIIASLFRYSWLLSLVVLIPLFANSKSEWTKYSLIYVLVLLMGLIYMKLFFSNNATRFFTIFGTDKSFLIQLNEYFSYLYSNVKELLLGRKTLSYFFNKYIFLLCLIYLVRKLLTINKKLAYSILLLVIIEFSCLIFLEDAFDWREHRAVAHLVYLIFILFTFIAEKKWVIALLLSQTLLFMVDYKGVNSVITSHQKVYQELKTSNYDFDKDTFILNSLHKNNLRIIRKEKGLDGVTYLLEIPLTDSLGNSIYYSFDYSNKYR